ncbi:MAG: peptide chain release factor-like protein [Planctomycetaceae bacterium]|nr:peptide chain release factor-like protein [Planctomycetales bacterium]MCB9921799.1 peptide chain release factor-like protein [Planctomycetaceae bacterium]
MTQQLLHPAALDESALLSMCELRRQRRSGPGGQHRNKVETAVVITHQPTGIQGEASERRSQEQNRRVAIRRLRVNLAIGHRTACVAEAYRPSELWRQRCRSQRISVNPAHEEFPAILAEAMNLLAACGWQTKEASGHLGCSPTQLLKLLQHEPRAYTELNQQRSAIGLRPLR